MNLLEVECNICSARNSKVIFEVERYNTIFKIQQCLDCGLVYLNPRPQSTQLDEDYSNVYDYEGFLKNADYLKTKCRENLELILKYKKNGNLLEVGCMYGLLLEQAQRQGFNVYGVEISQKATEYARQNFGLNIFNGRLEESSFDDRFFDVIFLSHLIEHLEDPMGSLKMMVKIMKLDGVLLLKCPNFGSLMSKITGKNWCWIAPPEHLYHFTARTITNLLNKAGFTNVTVFTDGCDLAYLRYLTVEIGNLLPVSREYKAEYRAKIDEQPEHFSQKLLLSIYKLSLPVIYLIQKAKLGEEMIVVARRQKD